MRMIRPVVRSLTSALPSGRKTRPHGTCRPVTIVRGERGTGAAVVVPRLVAVAVAVRVTVGLAGLLDEPLQPAMTAITAHAARRRFIASACPLALHLHRLADLFTRPMTEVAD